MVLAALAARCGLDPDVDLYPILVCASVGAAFQAAMKRWYSLRAGRSVTGLFDEAMTSLVKGLPKPEGEK
jgi:hypothetical protein